MKQQRLDWFRKYYDLEFEVMTNWEPEVVSQHYLELLNEGRQQGFHPIFVSWEVLLSEQIQAELGDSDEDNRQQEMADHMQRLVRAAQESMNVDRFFQERAQQFGVPELDFGASFDLEDKHELELLEFLYPLSKFKGPDGETVFDLLLVKVPTALPEEIFAYFPLGSTNLCPPPTQLMALAAKWRDRFGAVPAVITFDAVEFYVPRPPATVHAAAELAREQYLVCPQLVEQICGNLEALTSNLIKNAQWFFWWR